MWLLRPAAIYTQSVHSMLTPLMAERVIFAHNVMRWNRRGLAKENRGFVIINDYRSVTKYERPALDVFKRAWEETVGTGEIRMMATALPINPLFRLAFNMVNLSAALIEGVSNKMVADPEPLIDELGLKAPAPDEELTDVLEALARGPGS